jgi:opacity protein-like surface antigen
MKKVLLVLLAVLVVANLSFAQDVKPAVKSGSKSLNFTFGGFGGFGITGTGPMGGVGLSYFMNPDAALRLGLQVASNSTKTPANPTPPATGVDGESSVLAIGVAVDYLMYMNAGRVRPFWGAGAGVTFGSNSTKPAITGNPPGTQPETKNNPNVGPTGVTFGVSGIVGAEFFIFNELGLSAEYRLNLVTVNSPADREDIVGNQTTTTKQPSSTAILGFGAGGATVHIYF